MVLMTTPTSVSFANEQDQWGIAAVYRTASIPFETANNDQAVGTFVPMMYFENEHVFIDGLQGGLHLWQSEDEKIQFNALMRMRFVDIPASEQNANGGDTVDFGGQLSYSITERWRMNTELMTDDEFRFHANLGLKGHYEYQDWELNPFAEIRYKDADFNTHYYTFSDVTDERLGAGVDLRVGLDARYHVYSNLYLLGAASVRRLDSNAYRSSTVEDRYQGEVFVGFGIFNDKSSPPDTKLSHSRYVRVAHGWATPSNIGEILALETESDQYNNQMSSFFYGHPLTDQLFGVPMELYFTPGIAHHWSSDVQSASTEYIAAIKVYYTIDWPFTWRLGFAEGMSFIDSITYIEQTEMDEKGYKASNLLNYLDLSLDVNLGELVGYSELNKVWFGYSLHHRSAIFEQASQYGRIKGGSNYNTIYLQFDF
nr:MipA/OmpV family protein [Vibrio zhanjiangensis]